MKAIVIGGVAAGMSAASKLRRVMPDAQITVYERGGYLSSGACVAGARGAVLRADIFAVAIHAGMSTDELGMVDLAYAPPFAGVWDAVHIAANAAK